MTPHQRRVLVAEWAEREASRWAYGEVVSPDQYWLSALGRDPHDASLHWCGIFALAALHAGGCALDVQWQLGQGFVLPCGLTRRACLADVQPADVVVWTRAWHHAIVVGVDGDRMCTVEGNATNKRVVVARSRDFDRVTYGVFDTEPLIPES